MNALMPTVRYHYQLSRDALYLELPPGTNAAVGETLYLITRFPSRPTITLALGESGRRLAPLLSGVDSVLSWPGMPIGPQRMVLKADPRTAAAYRARLQAYPKPWIGFSFAGGLDGERHRNIDDAAGVEALPGSVFDIQHEVGAIAERARKLQRCCRNIGRPLIRLAGFDPVANLPDAAALISQLDAVITVDNSNAFLAPALGVPTYLLARRADLEYVLAESAWQTLHIIERAGSREAAIQRAAAALTAQFNRGETWHDPK